MITHYCHPGQTGLLLNAMFIAQPDKYHLAYSQQEPSSYQLSHVVTLFSATTPSTPPPHNHRPPSQGVDFELFLGRFRVEFALIASRDSKSTRKRLENNRKTTRNGVGVFHVNGWGPKSSIRPFETREIKLFGRDIPGFCRDIPEVPEKFEKKGLCSISGP